MLSATQLRFRVSPGTRLGLLVGAVLVCAAVAFGAVELARPGAQPTSVTGGPRTNGLPGPTVAQPLGSRATEVTMAQATATWGAALPLPSTPAAQPSDAGQVWALSTPGGTSVAITFPAKGVFIQYSRPVPPDPASHLQAMSANVPGSDLVQLNEKTPALYLIGNDGSGLNDLILETNNAEIRVVGSNDEATLEAMAQSILAQLSSSASS